MIAVPSLKKLISARSSIGLGLLLIASSVVYGFYYEGSSSPLHERVSEDGYGYVLEKVDEPTGFERESGRKALPLFSSAKDRYKLAYELVRGKTLIGMDGVEITYALGAPTAARKDTYKRLKYSATDKDHRSCDLYVTFDGQAVEPKVVYASLFVSGNSRD